MPPKPTPPPGRKPSEAAPAKAAAAAPAKEPAKAPAAKEPAKAPAAKEPAKAPAAKEPAKAPAAKEPAKALATKEPAKAPAAKEPAKAPAKEPAKAPASKEPSKAPSKEPPSKGVVGKVPAPPPARKSVVEAPATPPPAAASEPAAPEPVPAPPPPKEPAPTGASLRQGSLGGGGGGVATADVTDLEDLSDEKPHAPVKSAAATGAAATEAPSSGDAEDDDVQQVERIPLAEKPTFICAGPQNLDATAIKTELFKCFATNNDLFHVEQTLPGGEKKWFFYNDTSEFDCVVRVTFKKCFPAALGTAKISSTADKHGCIVGIDRVPPGETRPFCVGKLRNFEIECETVEMSPEDRAAMINKSKKELDAEIAAMDKLVKSLPADKRRDIDEVVSQCIQKGVAFIDLDFKPLFEESVSKAGDEPLEVLPLMRPRQFLPPGIKVCLINDVEPNDIDQGLLGDCWLLCAISALAEFPEKVADVFKHPVSQEAGLKEQAIGAYRVTINEGGWWRIVLMDDYLPVVGRHACFAKNNEDPGELWVSMLEKAIAKSRGSYARIIGGDPLHALEDLTGYPTARLDAPWQAAKGGDDEAASKAMFERMLKYDEAGYLQTVATPGSEDREGEDMEELQKEFDKAGLTLDHSYTVIEVKHFPELGARLLKIRNPWGQSTEWTGDWSDEDPRWTQHPEVAKACRFTGPSGDGTFWMPYEEALNFFDSAGVCFMSNNWFDYRIKADFHEGIPSVCLRVLCREKTNMFIILSQKAQPGWDPGNADSKYAGVMMSVAANAGAASGKRYNVVANSTSIFDEPSADFTFLVGRSLGLLFTMEPSDKPYYIVPRAYQALVNRGFVLGLIADKEVSSGGALEVTFHKLSPDVKIFENFDVFDMEESQLSPVTAPYQYNPEVGAPETHSGASINVASDKSKGEVGGLGLKKGGKK